jgi:hypothetical protein
MAGSTPVEPDRDDRSQSAVPSASFSGPESRGRDPLREARRRATEWKPLLDLTGALVTLLVPIFCIRVLILARFDPHVATALVANSSPSTMGLSILVLVFPFLGFLFGMGICSVAGSRAQRLGKKALLSSAVYIVLACCCALPLIGSSTGRVGPVVAPVLFFTLLITFMSAMSTAGGFWDYSPYVKIVVIMSVVTSLVLVVAGRGAEGMWLPPERALVTGQPQTIYVLRVEDADAILYLPGQAEVKRQALANIEARQFCRDADQGNTLAADWFSEPKDLPDCP